MARGPLNPIMNAIGQGAGPASIMQALARPRPAANPLQSILGSEEDLTTQGMVNPVAQLMGRAMPQQIARPQAPAQEVQAEAPAPQAPAPQPQRQMARAPSGEPQAQAPQASREPTSFEDRMDAVYEALNNGTFDAQGANATTFVAPATAVQRLVAAGQHLTPRQGEFPNPLLDQATSAVKGVDEKINQKNWDKMMKELPATGNIEDRRDEKGWWNKSADEMTTADMDELDKVALDNKDPSARDLAVRRALELRQEAEDKLAIKEELARMRARLDEGRK